MKCRSISSSRHNWSSKPLVVLQVSLTSSKMSQSIRNNLQEVSQLHIRFEIHEDFLVILIYLHQLLLDVYPVMHETQQEMLASVWPPKKWLYHSAVTCKKCQTTYPFWNPWTLSGHSMQTNCPTVKYLLDVYPESCMKATRNVTSPDTNDVRNIHSSPTRRWPTNC
jgi:hypothetical protein